MATKVSKQQRKQANKKLKEMSVELTKLERVLSEVYFWSNHLFLFWLDVINPHGFFLLHNLFHAFHILFFKGAAMSCCKVRHQSGES